MTDSKSHEAAVIDHYRRAHAASAEGHRSGWLTPIQAEAIEHFAELGFPTRRQEEWRYTNVAVIAKQEFIPAERADLESSECAGLVLPDFGGGRLVFVDGFFADALSTLPEASEFGFQSLFEASQQADLEQDSVLAHYGTLVCAKDDGFSALNTAFANDGAVVTLKADATPSAPLQIVFVSSAVSSAETAAVTPRASFPRVLIVAEPGSRGSIVLDHVSLDAGVTLSCAVAEVVTEERASLEMVLVQRESDAGFHIARQRVRQQRDSRFSLHTLNLSGAIVRNELDVLLADEGAECQLNGLYLGSGRQLVDNHTLVDHAMPHCQSHEFYKGILTDRARGVFRGRVLVRPGAQGTVAEQQNRNLLLSRTAEVDTKPQLEIYADDVKCNHGSSIGQLDEEALFFLRSRGLDKQAARTLLATGFAAQISQSISHERVRQWAEAAIEARLEELFRAGAAQ